MISRDLTSAEPGRTSKWLVSQSPSLSHDVVAGPSLAVAYIVEELSLTILSPARLTVS